MKTLKLPFKVIPNELYSLVIEDADGVMHFWLKNGDYDGYDRECKK